MVVFVLSLSFIPSPVYLPEFIHIFLSVNGSPPHFPELLWTFFLFSVCCLSLGFEEQSSWGLLVYCTANPLSVLQSGVFNLCV